MRRMFAPGRLQAIKGKCDLITPPGTVFASEAFAATLAASGQDDFVLEYVGLVRLAKGFGESRVYRVASR